FLLVWLWVYRSDRASRANLLLSDRVASDVLPAGLIAFAVATAAFWYALITVTLVPPLSGPHFHWFDKHDWQTLFTLRNFACPDASVYPGLFVLFLAMVICARHLPHPHRGWACGLVAALLVWFNPMNLLDSHIWPQWDIWIIPVFLTAALFAS